MRLYRKILLVPICCYLGLLMIVGDLLQVHAAAVDLESTCAQFDAEVKLKGLDSWEKLQHYDSVVLMSGMAPAQLRRLLFDRDRSPVIRIIAYYLLTEDRLPKPADALLHCWYNSEGAIYPFLLKLSEQAKDDLETLDSSDETLQAISRFLSVEDTAENRGVALFVLRHIPGQVLYDWLAQEDQLQITPGLEALLLQALYSKASRNREQMPADTTDVVIQSVQKYKDCKGLPRLVYFSIFQPKNPAGLIEQILSDETLTESELGMLFYCTFARENKERFDSIIDKLAESSSNQLLLDRIEKFRQK